MDSTGRNDLLDSFLLESWEGLGAFQQLARALGAQGGSSHPLDARTVEELRIVSHRLRGSAAIYGFDQTARVAGMVERVLAGAPALDADARRTLNAFLDTAESCLSAALERIGDHGHEGAVGLYLEQIGGGELLTQLLQQAPAAFCVASNEGEARAGADPGEGTLDPVTRLQAWRRRHAEDWRYFAEEAFEQLERARDALLTLPESGEELFRAVHTVKGAAYMVGLEMFGDLAHELEELLVELRDGRREVDAPLRLALAEGTEALTSMLLAAGGDTPPLERRVSSFRAALAEVRGGEGAAVASIDAPPPDAAGAVPDESAADAASSAAPAARHARTEAVARALRAFVREQAEVWEYFGPEVEENLDLMESAVRALEGGDEAERDDASAVADLYRGAHTIKGSAAMVGLPEMAEVGRDLQDRTAPVRDEGAPFGPEVDAVRAGCDLLRAMTAVVAAEERDATPDDSTSTAPLSDALIAFDRARGETPDLIREPAPDPAPASKTAPAAAAPERDDASAEAGSGAPVSVNATVRVDVARLDSLAELAADMLMTRTRLETLVERLGEAVDTLDAARDRVGATVDEFERKYLDPTLRIEGANADPEDASGTTSGTAPASGAAATGPSRIGATVGEMFDELELDSYNDLNIVARSVAELGNDLAEMQGVFDVLRRDFEREGDGVGELARRLRSEVGQARMVPVGSLFGRLQRLLPGARDGKAFDLHVEGEAIELDTLILDRLSEPLLHLLRNAVAHGVEPRDARIAAGKDERGAIALRAAHRENRVLIEVEDDGGGIDTERIREVARERGLRSPEQLAALDDEAALQLIFLPGLSTAREVSTEAGRGVGMDAVAAAVRQMGGQIRIDSRPGRGTRFRLELPLTLVASEALGIEVAGARFGLLLESVVEVRPLSGDLLEAEAPTLRVGGEALPLLDLHALLGLPRPDGSAFEAVIVRADGRRVALAVSRLASIEDVVIRNIGDLLRPLEYLASAAVAADGRVLPILDPGGLRRLATLAPAGAAVAAPEPAAAPAAASGGEGARLLLIDDSISVRKIVGGMLRRNGYRVTTAGDGQHALDILREDAGFDAILTDLEMPRVNGYELIEEVRRTAATAATPLVVMTTRAGAKHMTLARELGADEYLAKPIDDGALLGFLERSLSGIGGGVR